MNYKAIMLDVDDTIVPLGIDNLPSKRVMEAMTKARKRIHVCLVTARTLRASMKLLSHLKLSGPCVLSNGTQIYDPVKRKIIHEVFMPAEVVPQILEIGKQYNTKFRLYDGEKEAPYCRSRTKKVVSMYIPEIELDQVDSVVRALSVVPQVSIQKLQAWDTRYLAILVTNKQASKLHGIVEVARILNIKTEEIIGVGDGYNDFPLLMACGLKIAMGNAVPELKAIADFVAPSVDEDGVATVIEKFVL
jgi:hydroxymethylpyrimidine pyrophosphatase-like HAD family hydrolase